PPAADGPRHRPGRRRGARVLRRAPVEAAPGRASMSRMAARRAQIIRFPARPAAPPGAPGAAAPPTGPPAAGAPAESLVEARRCRDQAEALVVRGLLESEGIHVVLQSRLAQSVYRCSVADEAEVLLLVAAAALPRARVVLARRADTPRRPATGRTSPGRGPACG